ncbi:SPOR domain-containing protein [Candidatus Parabeggiatoa sp. HSG14]|uniref:SPOR domain-containing protein n=1 Tax=Candidatus Parabeggiatoa sp. HSG14 TaxID=3055593 RepID=UPI0025A7A362|nr:SPOR domain-containing protein [Thiotrichales bacterium HSG14]
MLKKSLPMMLLVFLVTLGANAEAGLGKIAWKVVRQVVVGVSVDIATDKVKESIDNNQEKRDEYLGKLGDLHQQISQAEEQNGYPDQLELQETKQVLQELESFVNEKGGSLQDIDDGLSKIRSDEGWFVILGSYPKARLNEAKKRKDKLQNYGYVGIYIADTDNYPNLRNGLYIVTLGPLQKRDAKRFKNELTRYVSDAYIKSGW